MTRSRVISALLGLVLIACAAVIVLDQQGTFGNSPFPWPGSSSTQGSGYDLPPSPTVPDTSLPDPGLPDTTQTPTPAAPPDDTIEIQPTPTPPADNSGYGDLK